MSKSKILLPIEKGSKGYTVSVVQKILTKIGKQRLTVDGDFGPRTEYAVKLMQQDLKRPATGVVTRELYDIIVALYKGKDDGLQMKIGNGRFVAFIDAGHGGFRNGVYQTVGKQMYHANVPGHHGGNYWEGYENRLIAQAFADACVKAGVMPIMLHSPQSDWSLTHRVNLLKEYLRSGYVGYTSSIHSNAISLKSSALKLKNTRGFTVFTSRDTDNLNNQPDFSDEIARVHYAHVKEEFGEEFMFGRRNENMPDYDRDFQILRDPEAGDYNGRYLGSFLEEFGFHTSYLDVAFITKESTRDRRVKCLMRTAMWVKAQYEAGKTW